jgi:hypothetical protein
MTGLSQEPPLARCLLGDFGELTADRAAAPWRAIEPFPLADVTAGSAPEQGTEVQLGWTRDEFRVLFHASDTEPWATLTARDAPLYTEEVVEVFLDPVGDLESYFEIEVNPLNAVLDLVIRRNRSGLVKNFKWHCEGLRTAVRTGGGFWSAELAIPFRGLVAESPTEGTRWRANFCRIDRPRGKLRELTAWSPTGRPLFHVPERFGAIAFASGATPPARCES